MSAGWERLREAYAERGAAWLAHKPAGPLVGYVGNTVPVELIVASGAMPLRVAPIAGSTAAADPHVEAFTDLDARLVFAQFVRGELDALDLLVIPRSTEIQHKLYLALREARRTGVARSDGPPLLLFDLLHTQRPTSHAWGLARAAALGQRLAALSGRSADDAAFAAAIAQGNELRSLLAMLQHERRAGRIAGSQAQQATGATRFLPAAAAIDALRQWLREGPHQPARGPRLLVKGVPLDHAELHRQVEQAGADIVAEDDDWGSRAAEPLIDTRLPPLTAIVEHYWRDVPCPRIHPSPLAGSWFARRLAGGGIDAVLFHLPRPDDIHGWTFPAERALVERSGLPWALLRDDARHTDLHEPLAGLVRGLKR